MNRKQVLNILKIIISLSLIFFILNTVDLGELAQVMTNANFAWLGVAYAMALLGVVTRAKRWQILLDALEVRVPLKELVNIYFIGFLFNNLLPSGLGGDAIRMMELNRHSERASDAVTSVLVDRMLGLFGMLSIALVALIFRWDVVPPQVGWLSIALFVGIIGAGVVLVNRPLYETARRIPPVRLITDIKFINNLFESFQTYSWRAIGQSFLVALLFNVILITMITSIGTALGAQVALVHYLVFIPLTSVVLLLPVSFAGLGMREGAYIYLFTQVGVAEEVALGMSLLVYAIGNLSLGLIGGVIYLWRGARGLQKPPSE